MRGVLGKLGNANTRQPLFLLFPRSPRVCLDSWIAYSFAPHANSVPLDLPSIEGSDPASGTLGLSASCWPIESMNGEPLWMSTWFLSLPPGSRSATQWSFLPSFLSFPSSCCHFCRCPLVCVCARLWKSRMVQRSSPWGAWASQIKHTHISLPSLLFLPSFYLGNDILTHQSFRLDAPSSFPSLWLSNQTSRTLLSRACLLSPVSPLQFWLSAST